MQLGSRKSTIRASFKNGAALEFLMKLLHLASHLLVPARQMPQMPLNQLSFRFNARLWEVERQWARMQLAVRLAKDFLSTGLTRLPGDNHPRPIMSAPSIALEMPAWGRPPGLLHARLHELRYSYKAVRSPLASHRYTISYTQLKKKKTP
ncbi:hypothetical protein LZ32DRAFT_190189 [Colletotrichum eremochloae]|nr:hypothetical protein LZ32DRAFT_190189 [Colletotrichum eremochloae]